MAKKNRALAYVALWRALRGASGPDSPGLGESLRAVPRLVMASLFGRYPGTTRGELGLMGAALLYVVSPIDLLPDFLPLIGIADDAVVVTWLAGRLLTEATEFLRWERAAGPAAGSAPADGPIVTGRVVRG